MDIRKNTTHAVVAQYAYDTHDAGDIVSQHSSYAAAEKAAKNNTFVRIVDVRDLRAGR